LVLSLEPLAKLQFCKSNGVDKQRPPFRRTRLWSGLKPGFAITSLVMIEFICLLFGAEMVFTKFRKIFCILFAAGLSLAFINCGGGSDSTQVEETASAHSVTGKITYKRPPIKVADTGYPIGLDYDNPETLPLRGISVRAVYSTEETMPDESKVVVWNVASSTSTNSDGEFTINLPDDDTLPAYIEIRSVFTGYDIRIIADVIDSFVPQADRFIYSIRIGLDGVRSEDNPRPAVVKEGKITLDDIVIDLSDKWWIGHSSVKHASETVLETYGSGSRIAAIIDTAYKATELFGNPTPSYSLDLHYKRGISEPLGTYVEYDVERFPLSFEPIGASSGGSLRHFGTVRYDDAWHEGALLSMMARNFMRSSRYPSRFQFPSRKYPGFDPRNKSMMTNLHPTMAMAEGLPDAIAAIALKTPYLTAGSGTEVPDVLDVREVEGLPRNIYSAPAITAFTWELALKANEITSPGAPDAWKEMENLSINRFYSLQTIYKYIDEENSLTDLPSLFTQLFTLGSYAQSSTEPINLAEIFTDEVLTEMTKTFFSKELWPIQTTEGENQYSKLITDWGSDPNSAKTPLPAFTFSMSDAVHDSQGDFSNLTHKENFSASFKLTKDTAYRMSVTAVPALPSGASIEVRFNGSKLFSYIFDSSSSNPQRVVLTGNPDSPIEHTLDFSLKSPTIRVPDETQITVLLEPAY